MLVKFKDERKAIVMNFREAIPIYKAGLKLYDINDKNTEKFFAAELIRLVGDLTGSIFKIWTGEQNNAFAAMDEEGYPKSGLGGDVAVAIIHGDLDTYYTKFWFEDSKKVNAILSTFIKDKYEIGEVDEYTMEFKKIK